MSLFQWGGYKFDMQNKYLRNQNYLHKLPLWLLSKLLWMSSLWPLSPKLLQARWPCFPPFSSQNIGNFGMQGHAWVCAVSFQFRMWMRMSERMRAGGLNGQSMLSIVTKVWTKMSIAAWQKRQLMSHSLPLLLHKISVRSHNNSTKK